MGILVRQIDINDCSYILPLGAMRNAASRKENWRRKKGAKQKERDFTLALFVWGYSGTTISLTSVSESKLTFIPTAIAANPVAPILMQYTGKLFPITPLAGIC